MLKIGSSRHAAFRNKLVVLQVIKCNNFFSFCSEVSEQSELRKYHYLNRRSHSKKRQFDFPYFLHWNLCEIPWSPFIWEHTLFSMAFNNALR